MIHRAWGASSHRAEKRGYLLTQVIDSGNGIESRVLKQLFTTFNNPNTGVLKTQGIGIGLSTAKVLS